MKKLLLLTLLFGSITITANAQWALLPQGVRSEVDTTKKFIVLEFQNIKQEDLINNVKSFIIEKYISAKNVMSDATTNAVSINGTTLIALAKNKNFYRMEYSISFTSKDNKLKVNILDVILNWGESSKNSPMLISWHNGNSISRICGYIYDKNNQLKQAEMKQNIDNFFNKFTADLKEYVNGKNENW